MCSSNFSVLAQMTSLIRWVRLTFGVLRTKSSSETEQSAVTEGNADLGAVLARAQLFVVLEVERTGTTWNGCSPAALSPRPAVSRPAKGQGFSGHLICRSGGAVPWSCRATEPPCRTPAVLERRSVSAVCTDEAVLCARVQGKNCLG